MRASRNDDFPSHLDSACGTAAPSGRADLTSEESEWAGRYRAVSEILVAKGTDLVRPFGVGFVLEELEHLAAIHLKGVPRMTVRGRIRINSATW
jgi:hypothetical protein